MTQAIRDWHWPSSHRVVVATLVALLVAALAWFAIDRFTGEEAGGAEVVTVGGLPQESEEPRESPMTSEMNDGTAGSESSAIQTPPQPDLGLERIVREFLLSIHGGETAGDDSDHFAGLFEKLDSANSEIRRRGEFEVELYAELGARFTADPYYPALRKSLFDSWGQCLNEYGLPSLEDLGQLTEEQQEALMKELGLVGEKVRELEDKCWGQSRNVAGKNEETDRLLGLQYQYYLSAAQAWVKANSDKVVPLPG